MLAPLAPSSAGPMLVSTMAQQQAHQQARLERLRSRQRKPGEASFIYWDAHFGKDRWCSFGLNGSYQGSIENAAGEGDGSNAAGGVDGMIDLPVRAGRLLVKGELNAIRKEIPGSTVENNVTLRMIGAGFLIMKERLQPFVRFDQVRGDVALADDRGPARGSVGCHRVQPAIVGA